jgi:hypothetical protein
VLSDLIRGSRALQRHEAPAWFKQRKAPSHQSIKWRYRSRGNPLRGSDGLSNHLVLCPTADNPNLIA